jgi:hypothetical protein
MGTLHKDLFTFIVVSRRILRIRNVSDEGCTGNQNTHFTFSNFFPSRKSHCLYEIVRKYSRARQATDLTI